MKKIVLVISLLSIVSGAGVFGDTEEERAIAQKRLSSKIFHSENPEIIKVRLENIRIKEELKKYQIDYEIALQSMRGETNTKEIKNQFTITEEEELVIVQRENQTLKKLIKENSIKKSDEKSYKETITIKPKMKIEMTDQAVEEVK